MGKKSGKLRMKCGKCGSECHVVLQIYDDKQHLKEGEYCNGYSIQGNGTLFLFNRGLSE